MDLQYNNDDRFITPVLRLLVCQYNSVWYCGELCLCTPRQIGTQLWTQIPLWGLILFYSEIIIAGLSKVAEAWNRRALHSSWHKDSCDNVSYIKGAKLKQDGVGGWWWLWKCVGVCGGRRGLVVDKTINSAVTWAAFLLFRLFFRIYQIYIDFLFWLVSCRKSCVAAFRQRKK